MASQGNSNQFDTLALWAKYEDIAMHFNDLLMRLRTRSLAAVAALSTLVGIFTKSGSGAPHVEWAVAAGVFSAMSIFWMAVSCLDFLYYNRLLSGAVRALTALEKQTAGGPVTSINMSITIEEEFTKKKRSKVPMGVLIFYGVVFAFVTAAAWLCFLMYLQSAPAHPERLCAVPADCLRPA